MTNKTRKIPFHKIRPLGGHVKVILEPLERLSDILEVVDNDRNKESMAREWGIIVELGTTAFSEVSPTPDHHVKVGDLAVFIRYAGQSMTDPEDKTIVYRMMNDTEIWGIVPKETLEAEGYDSSYAKQGLPEVVRAVRHSREARNNG